MRNIIFSINILCKIFLTLIFFIPLPSAALTQAEESRMGEEFIGQLYAMGLILDDPIATEYLQDVGDELVKVSGYTKRKFQFFILNDRTINAFAGPDGYIGVNAGLILTTKNESELASVLAHELAHVTQGHLSRQIAEMAKLKKAGLASMAGILALGILSPAAATAALATTLAGAEQYRLNFTRSQEKEADRVGMKTLNQSGFNPASMVDFFKKLQQEESIYEEVPELLRTHPLTDDRIADAEHRINQFKIKSIKNRLIYYLVKTRLKLMLANDPHAILTYFQNKLHNAADGDKKDAIEYGYAISLLAAQQPEKGEQLLQTLAHKYPDLIIFQLAYAQALISNNKTTLALTILAKTHRTHPDNYSTIVSYGLALIDAEKPQEAVQLLQRFILDYPDEEKPYGVLARAQALTGQLTAAYQTRAHHYLSRGAYEPALEQLRIAMQQPGNNAAVNKRLQAKITAMELEMQGSNEHLK